MSLANKKELSLLTRGETYKHRKEEILSMITSARSFIRTLNEIARKDKAEGRDIALELIEQEHRTIKYNMGQLIKLKKWQQERIKKYKLEKSNEKK